MSSGVGLRQAAATGNSQRPPVSVRGSLGVPWLIGVIVVPLLLAIIGYAALDRPKSATGPTGALPTLAPSGKSSVPNLSLAPLSISRNGNTITLSGDFPDDSAKTALTNALDGSLAPGINVIDQIRINPDVDSLDFSHAASIFRDSASISDFDMTVNGNAITLAGTAGSQVQKNTVESDAKRIWSNLNVVDNLAISASPSASPAAGPCADLQSAVNAATGGPIGFGNDGISLTPADEQILTEVANKLKACPNAQATINGYSDNAGAETTNVALSNRRAQTVANFLVAHGVAGDHLAVRGLGSANPVATNDTADGRAKNRRVEIVVS